MQTKITSEHNKNNIDSDTYIYAVRYLKSCQKKINKSFITCSKTSILSNGLLHSHLQRQNMHFPALKSKTDLSAILSKYAPSRSPGGDIACVLSH